MSDNKTYTAQEVARMILEKTQETLKKHEELLKSKNSAHEIDLGEEPKNDEAECPESLKANGSASSDKKSEKKPLAGEAEKKEESVAHETSESKEEEEKEESEDSEESSEKEKKPEMIFKKSESGMFTVQYNRIAKEENPDFHLRDTQENKKPQKKWTNSQKAFVDHGKSTKKPSSAEDQKKFEREAKERSKKLKEEANAPKAE